MKPWFWTFGLQNSERINFYYFACMLSHFSCVQLFATKCTIACHTSLSMGFSRQYWSELPCPLPGDFSWPRDRACISYVDLPWQCSLPLVPPGKPSVILSLSICGNLLDSIRKPIQPPWGCKEAKPCTCEKNTHLSDHWKKPGLFI